MRAAARLAFDTVQERWKLTRDSFVQGEPAAGTERERRRPPALAI